LPERFSVSVPPADNDICRSAVPAPKYLPERRPTAFPQHYIVLEVLVAVVQSIYRTTTPLDVT